MRNIAITGANGVVGKVLCERLSGTYDLTPIDLPVIDVTDRDQLAQAFEPADVLIHLAGVFDKEHCRSTTLDARNKLIFDSTLQTALGSGIRQFIHASSIHIEDSLGFMKDRSDNDFLTTCPGKFQTSTPSGYGKRKRMEESALEYVSRSFVDGVVSLRLGAVQPDNTPKTNRSDPVEIEHTRKVWLEHGDLARLVSSVIENPLTGYQAVYATSDNTGRFHDHTNNFGWEPLEDSLVIQGIFK